MWRIGCTCCENSWRDFMERTFVLIAPVDPVLHRVSCSYEIIPNAVKHYVTHQNMSLGSNGVDWVRSLRKIPMWLRGTNMSLRSNGVDWVRSLREIRMWLCGTKFCINCTSSHCFALSFIQLRNDRKCTQTLCSAPKHVFRVQWSGLGAFIEKNPDVTLWHELLH